MFRLTWAVSVATYGARFQKFCERRLDLDAGSVWSVVGADHLSGYERKLCAELQEEFDLKGADVLALRVLVLKAQEALRLKRLEQDGSADGSGDWEPDEREGLFGFTFGVAVLHPGAGDHPGLVYLRVRDHLRKLGLGRRALRHLIRDQHAVWPPEPLDDKQLARVSPEADLERLAEMFKSVWNELELNGGNNHKG